MPLQIVKATKKDAKARLALVGPTGSGKTYTALEIALGLAALDEIAVIDTEHKSSEKYAPIFGEFAVIHLDQYDPRTYVEAIELLVRSGYKVIIIDSLTHAWAGKGGALEIKEPPDPAERRQLLHRLVGRDPAPEPAHRHHHRRPGPHHRDHAGEDGPCPGSQ
jgi:hypothetical protein